MEEFDNIIEKYRRELMEISGMTQSAEDLQQTDEPEFPLSGIGEAAEESVKAEEAAPSQPESETQEMPGIEVTAGTPFGSPNREKFADYDEFLQNNPQNGTLKVQVYATDQAYPIDNARVTVYLELRGGARQMFTGLTDTDGIIDPVVLPAPDSAMSQRPSESEFLPYAVYTTLIERPGYVNAKYTNVPVFSGIQSIQGVEMVPLVAQGEGPEMPDMCTENQFSRLEGE